MRGNYFSDVDSIERRRREHSSLVRLTEENGDTLRAEALRNEKPIEAPEVLGGPDTVANESVRAIVAYVAHKSFLEDLKAFGVPALAGRYPALRGLTYEQVYAAIDEALA